MPSPSELTILPLLVSDGPEFDALVAIYLQSFPAEERKSIEVLRQMIEQPGYRFFLAREASATIGIAIAMHVTPDVALLEYMAIAPNHRGRGLGRALFQQTLNMLQQQTSAVLMEVESGAEPQQERRKRFYRSLGARPIAGLQWIMPTVASVPPPPMDLFLHGHMLATIHKATLHTWLTSIYVAVYGQHADDPRIAAMLAPLPEAIALA